MRFFINSRLRPQVSPERFIEYVKRQGVTDWEKFREGTLVYPHYKIGSAPGVLGFIEAVDEDEARFFLMQSPLSMLVEFDIEPVSPVALFQ